MNTQNKSWVLGGLFAFLFLGLQLPGAADPGYKPFEEFDRSETKDYWIQVGAGPVHSEIDGTFVLDEDLGDTEVDLDETLGLDDDTNGRARVQFQPSSGTSFRFGYYGIKYQNTKVLQRSITVDGQTYTATDSVDSTLRLDTYELGYNQNIFSNEYVSIGGMIQFNGIDFRTEVRNESTGVTASEESWVVVPYPGIRAEVFPVPWAGVYGEARIFKGSVSDLEFSSSDLDAGVQLNLNPNYDIRLGYRRFNYDVDFDETELDITSDGPYAMFTVRF